MVSYKPEIPLASSKSATARGYRWVSAVVDYVPYTTQVEVIDKYNIGGRVDSMSKRHSADFVVHGDDPVLISKRSEGRAI